MTLATLAARTDRCASGYAACHHPQLCPCDQGRSTKSAALAAVNATADPDVKARIDAAILTVARRGGEFSANDVRPLIPDIAGGVIGGRFGALSRRGVIEKCGFEASSKANTHGHDIKLWRLTPPPP